MKKVKVLGLMSGTSLDGVDLALCSFTLSGDKWSYEIEKAETKSYPEELLVSIKAIHKSSAEEYALLDTELGVYYASLIKEFLGGNRCDLIASHGHTVFHQPDKHFTSQIGSGAAIFALTEIPTVCDFRSVDVFLGGHGAPLVPLGDRELFSSFDYRINLGGIANVSYEEEGFTRAFDICPVNQVFNAVAQKYGKLYDGGGEIARSGVIIPELLEKLNGLGFYKQQAPKSLGREWVEKEFLSLMQQYDLKDFQRTVVEHVAIQITSIIKLNGQKVLFSGGGVYNIFLMDRIKSKLVGHEVVVPNAQLVDFKEALIFAFLGIRGVLGQSTSLASVTGAKYDSLSFAKYGVFQG